MSETRVHDGREFTVRNLDEEPLTPKEQSLHFRVEKMNAEQDEGETEYLNSWAVHTPRDTSGEEGYYL